MNRFRFPSVFLLALVLIQAGASQKLDTDKLKEMKARSIGPAGMSGRVTSVEAVAGDPRIIYIGTASGGVWKSTSGGTSWEPVFDDQKLQNIGAIAITQSNPDIVWVGTGEGNPRNSLNLGAGIYRTRDGGLTWEFMGLENTRNIHRIIIDPRDENTVYVGAHGNPWAEHPERGVYKTTDGGRTWDRILFVDDKTGVGDLVMDPSNPNKLFCAMWEHRRWPWFFKSGGTGSGLYVTLDGGKAWKKLTSEDGLPKGELGRMGLAIAPRNPDIIYAIIESGKNALYRSDDGGWKWAMVNDGSDIGNRPFYYFDIYADPANENRLYTLYSRVGVSEDGGKSFRTIADNIHSDHHAWWIHPDDPKYIIEGNDGGMAISRDRGETWQFMENLPLGQWYHIKVDNDFPYHIYGGLQDNGSWRGPAYVWRSGGIRNEYWQEVMFGDGFDVVPDPGNSRYGYAMSQEGNVGRYDVETGMTYSIKPTHPDPDIKLRFHWNAAIEQDPNDDATIYYGSQFVHRSRDRGLTWEIISPDLTTNDPEKQIYEESGGLTLDVTGAENHTTVLDISVSPVDGEVIWAGTDDGNVQLTRDGGETWTNLSSELPGLPANSWIPQIQPSTYNASEAWVIANNYRMGDFSTYAYRTRDFGASWEKIADDPEVYGYALCILQDPVEPKLVFLGTEHGLWVSIDNARNWARWPHGYPPVSTMDMVIQEREADLVIGTFGRSVYVLDDIRPLREIAATGGRVLDQKFKLFDPPDAVQIRSFQQPPGNHFPGDGTFEGENRTAGGILTYYFREDDQDNIPDKQNPDRRSRKGAGTADQVSRDPANKDSTGVKYDSIIIQVFDGEDLIRTLKYKARPGLNRVTWRLRKAGVQYPNRYSGRSGGSRSDTRQSEPAGFMVTPGEYKIVMTCGDQKDSALMNVVWDPRMEMDLQGFMASEAMFNEINKLAVALHKATTQLNESREVLEKVAGQVRGTTDQDLKEVAERTKTVQDSLDAVWRHILGREETRQGLYASDEVTVATLLNTTVNLVASRPHGPTATEELLLVRLEEMTAGALEMVNTFYRDTWPGYRDMVEGTDFRWFKDYVPIEVE